nr:hypothetical protein [Tanacetum cinerariifolium]
MINDAIKDSVGYKYYKIKKDQSEENNAEEELKEKNVSTVGRVRGKGYICLGNQQVNVSSKPKKAIVPQKQIFIIVADNIVEQETVPVELAKLISIEQQRFQQREIMTQLTIKKQVNKDVDEAYATERGQKLKGVATEDPVVHDATASSSWSDIDKYDEINDAENYYMDVSNDDFDKEDDDDAGGFGDPHDDHEGEKRRKDTGEPSRPSNKDKAPMDSIQENIPTDQP